MSEPSWLSLVPPLLAISLTLITRHVYLSLLGGLWVGYSILAAWNPLTGIADSIDGVISVLANASDAKVVVFTLVIGALIATLERSGGVQGFISSVEQKGWITQARQSQWLAWIIGIVIFIESNITVLVAGSISRPLFDRYKISREKLAYIIDSTSAPICILIPLNAWGAFNLGLLNELEGITPLQTFVGALPYNLYAFAAVILTAFVIGKDWNIGPMRAAEQRAQDGQVLWPGATPLIDSTTSASDSEPEHNTHNATRPAPRARNMLVPITAMLIMMPLGLYITGDGNLAQGSGSTSILWAVLFAVAIAWVLVLSQKLMNVDALTRTFLKGAGNLVPLALILMLALALGDLTIKLGTADYVASLIGPGLSAALLLPLVFVIAAGTAFSIGSSWGTFGILIPIAVPLAVTLGLPPEPFLAAVLSGGIFGDHASPISDTTIVASMAAATDHVDHVRTQLPYALCAGAVSTAGFILIGLFL
ncbi:MAG: Na+/H+ antiporter NhaC family protein [Pseudomonadales bacterium]